jgi:hypothetical protein
MTVQQAQSTKIHYVDLPDLPETFVDSVHVVVWDGQTLRVELCVTRYPEPGPEGVAEVTRYPSCRLVLTSQATVELLNRLQQTMTALAKTGAIAPKAPQGTA